MEIILYDVVLPKLFLHAGTANLLKSYLFCFYSLQEIETIRPFVYMCTQGTVMKWFHY